LGEAPPTPSAIAAAMKVQEAARDTAFARALYRGGVAQRLLSGTTHISVVDGRGAAPSLSASLGSGSGVVVPGTGIHLTNMLGELDLIGASEPGERLTSMMAPSIVLAGSRPRLVLGSAGSARLRGAILQVTANVVARGLDVASAVDAPRVHAESGVVHCEDGAVVGRLSLARDTHPASNHVADLGLMVAKDARGHGIGHALLETAVEWARASGIRKLELHVFPWNEPAIRLYERFGFEREGYRKGH